MIDLRLDEDLYYLFLDELACAWRFGQTSGRDRNGHVAAMITYHVVIVDLIKLHADTFGGDKQ